MIDTLRRIFSRKAASVASQSFTAMDHEMVRRTFGGMLSNTGKMVNEENALGISVAWGCIRVLSETIGSLPCAIYKRLKSGSTERADDHPLSEVFVHSPNANMTGVEYREAKVLNLCSAGNTYSYIRRNGTRIASLMPIRSGLCTPTLKKDGSVTYKVMENGVPVEYPQSDIWHVKGFGNNGLIGLSPIAAAREALGFAMATEEFGARFFSQGGMPSGILTVPNFLKDEQRKIARENLQQMLGGLQNAHKFALFEGGMKPEPWGDMPLDDMQFLLLRKFSVSEICRFYRVPPHMVADLDKATFSNIEHQSQEFVMFTLMPYFTRFEASAQKWLMTPKDRSDGYFLRFNFEGLLRADSAARSAFYSQMLQNGVMTRNEVRAKENLNRQEGLDGFTVQSAMIDIERLTDPAPAPAPVVVPPVDEDKKSRYFRIIQQAQS